jgi:hypothetical protein
MKKSILILALLFCDLSCSNVSVKDTVITKQNKDEVIEKVKKGKDLTGEEVSLFLGAMVKTAISGNQSIEGKTVRELINDQRKLVEEAKAREAEAKRLADETKVKEEKVAKELSEYIIVAPIKKELRYADYRRGIYKDEILIDLAFENKSDKNIRAFKGKTIFKDLFGQEICSINWYYDKGLKPKERKVFHGAIKYNQFNEQNVKLSSTKLENMKYEWVPVGMIFGDGTKLGIE